MTPSRVAPALHIGAAILGLTRPTTCGRMACWLDGASVAAGSPIEAWPIRRLQPIDGRRVVQRSLRCGSTEACVRTGAQVTAVPSRRAPRRALPGSFLCRIGVGE